MPIVPLRKQLRTVLFDRETALEIDCSIIYRALEREAGTSTIELTLEPGNSLSDGTWIPAPRLIDVPRRNVRLGALFPDNYKECMVKTVAVYGHVGLNPAQQMTRHEFVMELLDIWERLLHGMRYGSTVDKQENHILAAMEVLKSTYCFEELMPADLNMAKFKALFDPTKENSDGTVG